MSTKLFLCNIRAGVYRVIEELYPRSDRILKMTWPRVELLLEGWQKGLPLRALVSRVAELFAGNIAFYADARDKYIPIALMTTVATVLEMWEAGEGFSKSGVRGTVVKYADSFGAPPTLRKLLADKVPSFCLDVYHKLADVSGENRESEKRWRAEKAMQAMRPAVDYTVQTHEDDGFVFMTGEEVKEFKDKHKPEHYSIWIDKYEGCVFLDGAKTKLGYRLRPVLRYLVEHRGERVPHSQLVAACGFSRNDEKEDAKTSRRWVAALRGAGKGSLKELIETREGGFSYKGTATFCVISSLWEQD